ncbi:MAG: hemolysin family protein [Baekduia sp.]
MDDLLRIVIVLVLVGANAFFVIGEYAVVAARRSALAGRAEAGSARARAALRLMDNPVRVISTVQVGITALGILTGAIAEPLVRDLLGGGIPPWASFLLSFAIVTYLSVVFGELVPKALTLARAEALLLLVAPAVELLSTVLRPAVWLLERSSLIVLRPFGVRDVSTGDAIRSTEELRALVDEAEGTGVIPTPQETLLHNVIGFWGRRVLDVMVPAAEVVWLDADDTVGHGLARLVDEPHSRYPVADGSLASLRGVVHVRELVAAARADDATTVGSVARPAHIVPETKQLGELLEELRAGSHQLAAIVDEYGGLAGIVTLEDILEQLVGEIYDEYDAPAAPFRREADGTMVVAGWLPLSELATLTGAGFPGVAARTAGGAVFELLGRAPALGDGVRLGPFTATVTDVDGVRIRRLRLGGR